MSLKKTEPLPIAYEYFEKKLVMFLKGFNHVKGLNDAICQIMELKELNFHGKLIEKLGINRNNIIVKPFKFGISLKKDELRKVSLIELGSRNLNDPFFYPLRNKELINFPDFYFLYKFMEAVYFFNLGQILEKEDIRRLYFSGLDENIVSTLDNFEKISGKSNITNEFFLKLKQLKWKNDESKLFFNELNRARIDTVYDFTEFSDLDYSGNMSPSGSGLHRPNAQISTFPPLHKNAYILFGIPINRGVINYGIFFSVTDYGHPYFNFPATENAFLLFLVGCSAVNADRNRLNENDVIRAYKTYYKLLTSDILKLVDKIWKEKAKNKNNGYLVCDKCNEYYKLQPGESPDDFTNQCKCGGQLKYYDNIDWLFNEEL